MKSFAKFLPSKYFRGVLLSLLIVFVLVGASYALAERKNTHKTNSDIEIVAIGEGAQNNLYKMAEEQDSDNDGLKDWEEILWQTDSNNKDTDSDGTSDGEEVKANRNPAKEFPNDQLSASFSDIVTTKVLPNQKLTQT